KQAEVERAAALVKVREERKRRRVTLGLATALVLLLAGGSAGGFWYLHQEAEHERQLRETEKGVELALNDATKLLDRGLQEVDNPLTWGTTLTAARTTFEQARTLLAREPELAEGTLAQLVRVLQTRLEADEKDRGL